MRNLLIRLLKWVLGSIDNQQSYEFKIVKGELPKGLTLNESTGEVTGTPQIVEATTILLERKPK